jgi:hypothetical protein
MRDVDHFDELISEIERNPRSEIRNDNLLADPAEDKMYLISWSRRETNSADIRRIEQGKIRAPHLVIRGTESGYIQRWRRIGIGVLLAWLAHNFLLTVGGGWVMRPPDTVPGDDTDSRLCPGRHRTPHAGVCAGCRADCPGSFTDCLVFHERTMETVYLAN